MAAMVAGWSKDPSTKVGAVIVRPNRTIASVGYNGFPRDVGDDPDRYGDRTIKYELVVHAEANAILHAGEPVRGYSMYIWPFMPCSRCAGLIIQAGIQVVVSVEDENPRWQQSFDRTRMIFAEADVRLVLLPKELLVAA
jgi:dCMP deaminase